MKLGLEMKSRHGAHSDATLAIRSGGRGHV
jgi:hypothetical protein